MASTFPLPTATSPSMLTRTAFWGKQISPTHFPNSFLQSRQSITVYPTAKFNLSELLGGRGLCSGEQGLKKELQKPEPSEAPQTVSSEQESPAEDSAALVSLNLNEGAFEKELLGLTGGFPGGEKGLKEFIEKNPPPPRPRKGGGEVAVAFTAAGKSKPPELPLFMPGMIVIVKNPKNPFYMYCGIVQRITDGWAGVLFEGGNWDKLLTFRLEELERREKGPPMVNPKSAVLESLVEGK